MFLCPAHIVCDETSGCLPFEPYRLLLNYRHEKTPTSRLGEEAGTHRVDGGVRSAVASRLTTLPIDGTIVAHGRFLVYRVERLRCAIALGGGVLHFCTAEWARRSRDVPLAARVRKVRAPEGGMPANGRAE